MPCALEKIIMAGASGHISEHGVNSTLHTVTNIFPKAMILVMFSVVKTQNYARKPAFTSKKYKKQDER